MTEIFFPASIKDIFPFSVCLPTLKAIHFAGDIDTIDLYAFAHCTQLSTVEFAGKVNSIECCAFEGTAIQDIQIPDGTEVDPDAFYDTPFGNKKNLSNQERDIEFEKPTTNE